MNGPHIQFKNEWVDDDFDDDPAGPVWLRDCPQVPLISKDLGEPTKWYRLSEVRKIAAQFNLPVVEG